MAITLLATLLALSGCGTLISDSSPYSGVCLDTKIVAQGIPRGLGAWTCDIDVPSFWPLAVLDLPFSLVGDTLLLPFTLTAKLQMQSAEKLRQPLPEGGEPPPSSPTNAAPRQATNPAPTN
jgi:uncharacterized protein YceK